jgi:hypothetical protein
VWSALDRVEAGREGEVARELLRGGTVAWGSFDVYKLRGRNCLLFSVELPRLPLGSKHERCIRLLFAGEVIPVEGVVCDLSRVVSRDPVVIELELVERRDAFEGRPVIVSAIGRKWLLMR